MNAPHPIRALHGHLAVVETIETNRDDRFYAMGQLSAGMSGLEQAAFAIEAAAWYVDHALERGAGQRMDLDKLERISSSLNDVALKIEMAAARLSTKLAGAR
ncbi:hypothetical protein ABC766_29620 [Methylobacterium fujisawaense]|uniref:hypothetical protein n=1 Tax=Methylobacterium fujisawaense TaxID=107400 RepID=UPI0031F51D76